MLRLLFGDNFWLSPTPIVLIGLLAATVVLAWNWRISLPALFLVQLSIGQLANQRAMIPEQWSVVFAWVVAACALILFLSIAKSNESPATGRLGTLLFCSLSLGLAAFLLYSAELGNLLPLADSEMTGLILWMAICALFAAATASGALNNGVALMLWIISAEIALLVVSPTALVVVLLGTLFLLVSLACGYLIVAENLALTEQHQPQTDVFFLPKSARKEYSLLNQLPFLQRRLASFGRFGRSVLSARRGNQP